MKIKILKIIVSSLSILVLVPLGFLVKLFFNFTKVTHFEDFTIQEIEKILNYSLTNPNLLIPFIFFVILLVGLIFASLYLLHSAKSREDKIFAVLGILFFIPGATLIYWLITYLQKDKPKREYKRLNNILIKGFTVVVVPLGFLGSMIAGISFFSLRGVSYATNISNIKMSTDVSKPNVIQIFTDGLQTSYSMEYLYKDKKFKDFTFYPQSVSEGAFTNLSMPSMLNGLRYNAFNYKDVFHFKPGQVDTYEAIFPFALQDFFKQTDKVDHKYLVGPLGVTSTGNYGESVSGDTAYGQKLLKDVEILNWKKAKNDYTKYGIIKDSPDSLYYKWSSSHVKIDNSKSSNSIGARILIQDMITHSPRVTSPNGTLQFGALTNTVRKSYVAVNHVIGNYLNRLKQIKDSSGRSVYDNSLIMIYGDHANHEVAMTDPENNLNFKKWNVQVMIKYPDQIRSKAITSDRQIYVPFLRKIEEDFIKTRNKDFIERNINFKPGREFFVVNNRFKKMKYASYVHFDKDNHLVATLKNGKREWIFQDGHYVSKDNSQLIYRYNDDSFGKTEKEKQDRLLRRVRWIN